MLYPSPISGLIHSRRLGLSLGINLQPPDGKLCTFDCIYCECGLNAENRPTMPRPTRSEVAVALEERLRTLNTDGTRLDVITFSGNGEPTAHPDFPAIIADTLRLRDIYCPSAKVTVLSNATLCSREAVRDALLTVDNNILKLDTVSPEYIRLIDRPVSSAYDVRQVIESMKAFHGHCIVQTIFMHGARAANPRDNVKEEYIAPWLAALAYIRPRAVTIYTIDRTNLLHDIIAVPNIGIEIYLGRKFSLYMDYSGAWWGNRMSATYNAGRHVWRYEGGNLEVRRYLRRESAANPFTGWHIGVYGNIASYDFQWGDTGKQGRKPSYGGGLSVGYQKPIARRWNIDLSVAAGYFGGEYKTCRFRDGHNVWVDTRQRNYFGPTRAEIALVWLWGRGNENAAYKKGGRR